MSPNFTPIPDDEVEDDYRGGSGWVVVACGLRGRACVIEVDPRFGAMRWVMDQGLSDPDSELGLMTPEDPGVYRGEFTVRRRSSMHEGEHDVEFTRVTDWASVLLVDVGDGLPSFTFTPEILARLAALPQPPNDRHEA